MMGSNEIQNTYDRVASEYAAAFFDELHHKPFDRSLLEQFACRVGPQGQVWDIGCGPGHVARYLHEQGIAISGLDLSDGMIACARTLNPHLLFRQGNMLSLPMEANSVRGIVSFYAIIHLQREEAVRALQEFERVLEPGGFLLLAFHAGTGIIRTEGWFGQSVAVQATLFDGEEMEQYARLAGLSNVSVQERQPYPFEYQSRRIYLSACKAV